MLGWPDLLLLFDLNVGTCRGVCRLAVVDVQPACLQLLGLVDGALLGDQLQPLVLRGGGRQWRGNRGRGLLLEVCLVYADALGGLILLKLGALSLRLELN